MWCGWKTGVVGGMMGVVQERNMVRCEEGTWV